MNKIPAIKHTGEVTWVPDYGDTYNYAVRTSKRPSMGLTGISDTHEINIRHTLLKRQVATKPQRGCYQALYLYAPATWEDDRVVEWACHNVPTCFWATYPW